MPEGPKNGDTFIPGFEPPKEMTLEEAQVFVDRTFKTTGWVHAESDAASKRISPGHLCTVREVVRTTEGHIDLKIDVQEEGRAVAIVIYSYTVTLEQFLKFFKEVEPPAPGGVRPVISEQPDRPPRKSRRPRKNPPEITLTPKPPTEPPDLEPPWRPRAKPPEPEPLSFEGIDPRIILARQELVSYIENLRSQPELNLELEKLKDLFSSLMQVFSDVHRGGKTKIARIGSERTGQAEVSSAERYRFAIPLVPEETSMLTNLMMVSLGGLSRRIPSTKDAVERMKSELQEIINSRTPDA